SSGKSRPTGQRSQGRVGWSGSFEWVARSEDGHGLRSACGSPCSQCGLGHLPEGVS
ncbi:unnamed protein product, partial [Durusdinium trenchii]